MQTPFCALARSVVILLLAGLPAIGLAQTTPRPVLSLAVDRGVAEEGSTRPVRVDLSLDQPAPSGGVCIDVDLAGGSARPGEDFVLNSQIPRIPEGARNAFVEIRIIDDNVAEQDETLRIRIAQSDCYEVGMPGEFTLLIRDDDDDPGALADRMRALLDSVGDPLLASQIDSLGRLCATDRPPPGSELDRRCQLLRLALRDPSAAQQLIASLRGVVSEEFSSQRRGFRMLAGTQLGAVGRRLEAVRSGGGAGLALVDSGLQTRHGFLPLAAAAEDDELLGRGIGVFASIIVGRGERDSTDLESGYGSDSDTLFAGVDKRFGAHWVAGLAYSRTALDIDLEGDSGQLELDQNTLVAYLSRSFERGWIDGSLGFGRGEIVQTRVASFSGSTDEENFDNRDVLRAAPDVDLFTATVSGGYDWQYRNASFGPRLAIEYAELEVDRFAETAVEGSDAFAVELDAQEIQSFIGRLGFGAQWAVSTRNGILLPQLEASWVHQFEDTSESLRGRFVNDPQSLDFLLPTSTIDADYGEASASLAMQFTGGWSAFLSYRRLFGLADTEQAYWSLGARIEF
ncbi:autotransporter domain-containing protein [Pseudomarimonas arenosa]|uniref:Autotransporter domain-containing protein n=1 Tax=Pseudomarimonas arenosa TaxID=2774145 RepID=A0AAW3ZKA1_9GAMM|nr:autotransporter domain-containing protein [Pseudomarimonas arenosa]MBD8525467.1 autotransporter domain-containing protein [Pseudomarimonas arenosa]